MNSNEWLNVERQVIRLEANYEHLREKYNDILDSIKDIESNVEVSEKEIALVKAKLGNLEESIEKLTNNPFMVFTSNLDIKKCLYIIIVIVSIVSSLSTFDILVSSKQTEKQDDILHKLEKILETDANK